jgi:hypothetical protein
LTAAVCVPRIAAIEYPFGRTLGLPGDRDGQRAVLRSALHAVETLAAPGGIVHLPFEWPQTKKEAEAHPDPPPPIVSHIQGHIWDLPRLLYRKVPT